MDKQTRSMAEAEPGELIFASVPANPLICPRWEAVGHVASDGRYVGTGICRKTCTVQRLMKDAQVSKLAQNCIALPDLSALKHWLLACMPSCRPPIKPRTGWLHRICSAKGHERPANLFRSSVSRPLGSMRNVCPRSRTLLCSHPPPTQPELMLKKPQVHTCTVQQTLKREC